MQPLQEIAWSYKYKRTEVISFGEKFSSQIKAEIKTMSSQFFFNWVSGHKDESIEKYAFVKIRALYIKSGVLLYLQLNNPDFEESLPYIFK